MTLLAEIIYFISYKMDILDVITATSVLYDLVQIDTFKINNRLVETSIDSLRAPSNHACKLDPNCPPTNSDFDAKTVYKFIKSVPDLNGSNFEIVKESRKSLH